MAWTNAKTAVVATVILACAATTTLVVRQHKSGSANSGQPVHWDKSELAFAGYQTPEATLKTTLWAMSNGDTDAFMACYTPEGRAVFENQWRGRSKEALKEEGKQHFGRITGIKVVNEEKISDSRVVLTLFTEGENRTDKMSLVKIGDEWKMVK
jgi:hypothetical protein